ncbi:MAG: peptide chain release factor N(5)-glutamine methyltransferase [Clostridia bacterium]
MATYGDIYLEARREFKKLKIENADFEARDLACVATGKTTEEFLRDRQYVAPSGVCHKATSMIARRIAGEPLAYVLGEWDFYGMTLGLSRAVLIPRQDTEVLIDWTAAVIRKTIGEREFRFLDLGTGSGCIGVALGNAFPNSRGVLMDVSPNAVDVAKENVKRYNMLNRLFCVPGDMLEPADTRIGKFDVLVSNPPYITREELAELDAEVREFEPQGALFGGDDGLDFYRAILGGWLDILKDGGFIAFECGYKQARDLGRLMKAAGIEKIKIVEDTEGIQRVVSGFKKDSEVEI